MTKLRVGDLCHWKDNQGLWDVLVIYRGKSFSEELDWFDFVCDAKPGYENDGFHTNELETCMGNGTLTVIGHVDGVEPVQWHPTIYGKKAEK
jgi:hypothetical protein